MFVQGSHAFAMFLAHALRECALFRNTTYILTRVYVQVDLLGLFMETMSSQYYKCKNGERGVPNVYVCML